MAVGRPGVGYFLGCRAPRVRTGTDTCSRVPTGRQRRTNRGAVGLACGWPGSGEDDHESRTTTPHRLNTYPTPRFLYQHIFKIQETRTICSTGGPLSPYCREHSAVYTYLKLLAPRMHFQNTRGVVELDILSHRTICYLT